MNWCAVVFMGTVFALKMGGGTNLHVLIRSPKSCHEPNMTP